MTQLIALERKAKNDPVLKAYFWLLGHSWKLFKDIPSVINNIQNPMYDFSILKVMTVCINAYAS